MPKHRPPGISANRAAKEGEHQQRRFRHPPRPGPGLRLVDPEQGKRGEVDRGDGDGEVCGGWEVGHRFASLRIPAMILNGTEPQEMGVRRRVTVTPDQTRSTKLIVRFSVISITANRASPPYCSLIQTGRLQMTKLIKHVALVSESTQVPIGDVLKVASALQKQATRDLAPIWEIGATCNAYERLEDVPLDYWPMIVRDDIGYNAAGIHLDRNGQPFALISSATSLDEWSLTASHEACEMLVDPFGDRMVAGDSIKPGQGRVNYLVEVCDPSEGAPYAYSVNGVLVSDFYTPNFFDPVTASGVRYSFTGAITAPRTILRGGYISFVDMATEIWWQQTWFGGSAPTFRNLGKLSAKGSYRSQIDRKTWPDTAAAIAEGRESAMLAGMPTLAGDDGAKARADALHAQIADLVA